MNLAIYFFLAIAVLFASWRYWRRLNYFLDVFQLEGYKLNEFTAWLTANQKDLMLRLSHKIGIGVLLVGIAGFAAGLDTASALLMVLAWPVAFASSRRYRSDQVKKPIRYTNRMKRLLAASLLLGIIPLLLFLAFGAGRELLLIPHILAGLLIADLGAPQWVLTAAELLEPRENRIQEGFKQDAREKILSRPDLKIIAMTGSYGKTSVKNAIARILSHRYNVLATPGSFNTPMGLCLVINNQLKPEHQILVLEMGARYLGDIQELCDLVTPSIAIVTNVGVAHLETMGSQDNIELEKGTIVENVEPGGLAILNADDPRVNGMSARTHVANIFRVGIENTDADLVASDISYSREGASFVVTDRSDGTRQTFRSKLLGRHNIMNLLLAIAVGRAMDLRLRQMAHAVAQMEAVDHRLKLRDEGLITVLDDAFNSNPIGARNAVEILGQFRDGKRIIITPGMVELGDIQDEENEAFGRSIAENADVVMLIGPKQTAPIRRGLVDAGFPEDAIHTFNSLAEAQRYLGEIADKGDTVLYENDLPDHYDEAA